jgi:hypothetical protein
MAATILNSPRAIEMSVYVVRAFVQLREMLASNKELARRFAQLETRLDKKLTSCTPNCSASCASRVGHGTIRVSLHQSLRRIC